MALVGGALLAALAPGAPGVSRAEAATPCNVPSPAYATIQAAVDDARCGTIHVAAGTYYEHLTVGRDVTLGGDGQDRTILDGGGRSGSVVEITGGTVTIKGVTIQHGTNDAGGGIIVIEGTLTVTNSTVSGNSARDDGGGGIANNGTLTVTNSTVSGNSAGLDGGGIALNEGTLTVTNSTVSGNSAVSGGGIFNNEGTLTLTRTTLVNNTPDNCVGSGCP